MYRPLNTSIDHSTERDDDGPDVLCIYHGLITFLLTTGHKCLSRAQAMSTNGEAPGRQTVSPTTNGNSPKLVPTNNVTTKEGLTVRVRIEPSLAVDDVIRQLCISLKLKDPSAMYALRDETDELVTNDNLRKKIKAKANLK